jgi:ABC-type uncharacterized transport system YnjBCD ATPase subunit
VRRDGEAAVRQAQLFDWIQSLPQGYDTWVGEHGFRLSGGERQRLAIARALLRRSPFLIWFEPTANLDAGAERIILHTIQTATRAIGDHPPPGLEVWMKSGDAKWRVISAAIGELLAGGGVLDDPDQNQVTTLARS